jgi:hypothetical protein
MLAETEAKIPTAAPPEKAWLQERAEVLRDWLTPKSKIPLSTQLRIYPDWRTRPGPALVSDDGQRIALRRGIGGSRGASFSLGLVPSRSRRSSSMRARIIAKSSAARGWFTSAPPMLVVALKPALV